MLLANLSILPADEVYKGASCPTAQRLSNKSLYLQFICCGRKAHALLTTFDYFRSMKQFFFVIAFFVSFSLMAQPAWQQRVDTKIDVRLDDKNHFLHAFEEMTYTNNSPDTLKYIYIHLWPNAYKNDHTPMARQMDINGNSAFYYAKAIDRGYIDSLQFTIDGHSVDHYSADNVPDVARIDLLQPLLPGRSMKIATPFRVKIPKVFSRMGHTGQAYYISQWFPKPAVYDLLGWHPISYLDQGEFYSEYGSYDVSVTLPGNYVVMATGNCTDEHENNWLDSLSKLPLPADSSTQKKAPASVLETKTIHFHEDNIHDFAWFADKRWVVRKDTVYSPGNGQLVTAWAAFMPPYSKTWRKTTGYLKETVKHYGAWVGPYPYKTIKAVLGDLRAGGGMEYPTVTVIDKSSNSGLQTVIIHEAGHNWFYGLLGSNERDHAWMDEGINTFYEQKTTEAIKTDSAKAKKSKFDESLLYYEMAATHNDQAIDETSSNFTKLNYGLDVYYKTALTLKWLEHYIGPADFEQGMKDYFEKWHFHHPYPDDLRAALQRHTTKPVGWFFDTMLHTDRKIDFTITRAKVNGANTDLTIRNNTGVISPVLIDAIYKDSVVASAWTQPFEKTTTLTMPGTEWSRMKIDEDIPDAKTTNDVYRRSALFHRFGLKLKPVMGLNLGDKDKIFVAPSWGNNQYDGFMLGILLHDFTLPENRFRYAIAPMYGFHSGGIAGTGSVGYLWYPGSVFREILLQADAKTFHDNETSVNRTSPLFASYVKVAPSLTFTFKERDPLSPVTRTLMLKEYNIREQNFVFPADTISSPLVFSQDRIYGMLRYRHVNDRYYNPFSYSVEGHAGSDFAKLNVEGNVRIDYNVKNKSLYVRGYLGKYFAINNDPAVTQRYELNASFTGLDDYLYDGTYRGRNARNGLSAQQISIQEGGFKIPTYNGVDRSDNWMATINLKTDLPIGKWPVRLFFDAGLIPNATPSITNSSATTLLYDGGVEVWLSKDIVSVYFPLIMSSDFQNYLTNTYGRKNLYARSISFTFQLQNINWLKITSGVLRSSIN